MLPVRPLGIALAAIVFIVSACDSSGDGPASFQGLGVYEDGFSSSALAISADGKVVVGFGQGDKGRFGFRWDASVGMINLGSLPPASGFGQSIAYDVSRDGSVVVGESESGTGRAAFRWTASGGLEGLGELPSNPGRGSVYGSARGITPDGSVIVGQATGAENTWEAFRWTEAGGMQNLGALAEPNRNSPLNPGIADDVSSDGTVIVGAGNASGFEKAMTWRVGGTAEWLEEPADILGSSGASAVSADGSVIVGGKVGRACRWTAEGGFEWITESLRSAALDVSDDGRVIVGYGGGAFVWTEESGVQRIATVLADAGIDMTGWELISANGVSANGRVVTGTGKNPDGRTEAWRAVLP